MDTGHQILFQTPIFLLHKILTVQWLFDVNGVLEKNAVMVNAIHVSNRPAKLDDARAVGLPVRCIEHNHEGNGLREEPGWVCAQTQRYAETYADKHWNKKKVQTLCEFVCRWTCLSWYKTASLKTFPGLMFLNHGKNILSFYLGSGSLLYRAMAPVYYTLQCNHSTSMDLIRSAVYCKSSNIGMGCYVFQAGCTWGHSRRGPLLEQCCCFFCLQMILTTCSKQLFAFSNVIFLVLNKEIS